PSGEVAERSKALAWKASVRFTPYRGFESHPLRQPPLPSRRLRVIGPVAQSIRRASRSRRRRYAARHPAQRSCRQSRHAASRTRTCIGASPQRKGHTVERGNEHTGTQAVPISRIVNAERVVLLGWTRAILLQFAHPLIAAAIHEHSDFRSK